VPSNIGYMNPSSRP
jgi:hypothetical protein